LIPSNSIFTTGAHIKESGGQLSLLTTSGFQTVDLQGVEDSWTNDSGMRHYRSMIAHEEDCAHGGAAVGLGWVHEVLVRDGGNQSCIRNFKPVSLFHFSGLGVNRPYIFEIKGIFLNRPDQYIPVGLRQVIIPCRIRSDCIISMKNYYSNVGNGR